MASNALTGLGIALGGRTKDYTQVELAQRKQKQLEERAAKDKQAKELEDITGDIFTKPGKFLDFRRPQINQRYAQFIKDYQNAQGYGDKSELKFGLIQDLEKWRKEAEDYYNTRKNIASGTIKIDDDPDLLVTSRDEDEISRNIKYGGVSKTPEGTYYLNAYKNIDIPKRQRDIAQKVKIDWMEANTRPGPDGKPMLLGEPSKEDFKAMLGVDFDSNIDVQKNAKNTYRDQIEAAGIKYDTPEATALARELYINNGLPNLTGSALRGGGATNNFNIDVGQGDGQINYQAESTDGENINVTYTDPQGKPFVDAIYLRYGQAIGDNKATFPAGTEAYYMDTGEPVSDSDIKTGTYNKFGVVYVLDKDFVIGKTTYKKGTPIPKRYEKLAVEKGLARPQKVVFVKSGNRSWTGPAESYYQTAIIEATNSKNNPQKEILNTQFNKLNEDYKKVYAEYESYLKSLKGKSGKTSSQPKSVPSQGNPKKSFKNVPSGGFN